MSAFAVFGMTRAMAMEMAAKRTPSTRSNTKAPGGREMIPMEEWSQAVERAADRIMEAGTARQLSGMFDAPQYAEQFVELARKSGDCRGLVIRARAMLKDASGAPIKHKKTGAPRYGFQPWKG